ncbi:MAG TPA: glycosyltransferase family 4 protein [Actinomycetota bacterium]|jgi:glycogen(starch) synthase|nr:glycosyltransferase family 4 protein [Actinomycetota bacterium]
MLTWEFPPRIVGGLSTHVAGLSRALAAMGHRIHVLTVGQPEAPTEAWVDGVHVLRVPSPLPPTEPAGLIPWVVRFNTDLLDPGVDLLGTEGFDLIHAHDWLVAPAAIGLSGLCRRPLVATIHATERGRHQGYLPGPENEVIHRIERWLVEGADRLIACSRFMAGQLWREFDTSSLKVDVIPNGTVVPHAPRRPVHGYGARRSPEERLILFVGRLEFEKGVQTLLEALPAVHAQVPVRLLIAGTGTYEPCLRDRVRCSELSERVHFLGFCPQEQLHVVRAAADLCVVPSLYEPYGMAAVEAMAAGVPCIAAHTGGLAEVISPGRTGLLFRPGDPATLAAQMIRVLSQPDLARTLAEGGRREAATRFGWGSVARATIAAYGRIVGGASAVLRQGNGHAARGVVGGRLAEFTT